MRNNTLATPRASDYNGLSRSFIYPVPVEALDSHIQDPRTTFSFMCIALTLRSALRQHGRAADAGAADLHQTLPRRSPMSAERRNRDSQIPSKLRRLRIPLGTHSTTYDCILAGHETKRAQPNPSRLTELQSNSHQSVNMHRTSLRRERALHARRRGPSDKLCLARTVRRTPSVISTNTAYIRPSPTVAVVHPID